MFQISKKRGGYWMARPKKRTVDYFPHIIKDGKTITILENRFGNDGYAFWFKLLEILGDTDGHSYRYENTTNVEFLLAKTNVSEVKAEKILDLLAELEAIDKELWEHNIIWSDNFMENIADVYNKRSYDKPQKPVIDEENSKDEGFSERKPNDREVSDNKNSQSKVKESKVKETKVEQQPAGPDEISKMYMDVFGQMPKNYQYRCLETYLEKGMEKEVVLLALKQAGDNNADSIAYVKKILNAWHNKDIKTLEQAEMAVQEFKNKSSPGDTKSTAPKKTVDDLEAEGWT